MSAPTINDSLSYCRAQAAASVLASTDNILTQQFEELDATLQSLLQKAQKRRRVETHQPNALRRKIETLLGNWPCPRLPAPTTKKIAGSASHTVTALQWEVTEGVRADAVLIQPLAEGPHPAIVYTPDCSQTTAEVCAPGGIAWQLAARGCAVLTLPLISRSFSAGRFLNNRRVLHRLGWQLGQTLLGAEVAKARCAVRLLRAMKGVDKNRVGLFGYDQGGQVALLTATLESSVKCTVISNYFGSGEHPEWQPNDRLLFGEANLFDDATLATLCSPGNLCIEADSEGNWPDNALIASEGERNKPGFSRRIAFSAARRWARLARANFTGSVTPCGAGALKFLQQQLDLQVNNGETTIPVFSVADTELSRFKELEKYYYRQLGRARTHRANRRASRAQLYKEYRTVIGCFPKREKAFKTRWKLFRETSALLVYEVTVSVYKGVNLYGVLLVPKNIPAGERRPAVVCQHGFHGQPLFAAGFHDDEKAKVYHQYGARLAERGYVVFCPYLCVPTAEERTHLAKQAHLLGGSAIGLEVEKFSRGVDFLQSLPFVDGKRIGFYGLSYGGYTALWFCPSEPRFKVVICSGHFSDWHLKTTDYSFLNSCYLYTPDEDMYDFGMLEKFGHAELAAMNAPRPFAVEAGHKDGVFRMEWVRAEFKRVQQAYRERNAKSNAQLFEFDGPHEIYGKDTFPFLDKWLKYQPSVIQGD